MKYFALLAPALVTGCTWIGNTADSIGSHMPVIGERCEHWQCVTSGGETQSRLNQRERLAGPLTEHPHPVQGAAQPYQQAPQPPPPQEPPPPNEYRESEPEDGESSWWPF